MAQVIVRNLQDSVKHELQRLAVRHGHSMEAEIRQILTSAVMRHNGAPGLGSAIAERFRKTGFAAPTIPERKGQAARAAVLGK